jgi:regulator of sirC expression with transglutaminase-like and TPR domain
MPLADATLPSAPTPQAVTALDVLRRAAQQHDAELDLAETALALAVMQDPRLDPEPARQHLATVVQQLQDYGPLVKLDEQVKALRHVLGTLHHYHGDDAAYDGPDGANIIRTIERRAGLPVALGIIYLHVAEALGWTMRGLNVPQHFLLELESHDGIIVLDPFRVGQSIKPVLLQGIVPDGEEEEDADIIDGIARMTKRDVLLRLQNNVKRQQLVAGRTEAAIETLKTMILLAPRRDDLWREVGLLQAETGQMRAAINSLEIVGLLAPASAAQQASQLLQQVRQRLN